MSVDRLGRIKSVSQRRRPLVRRATEATADCNPHAVFRRRAALLTETHATLVALRRVQREWQATVLAVSDTREQASRLRDQLARQRAFLASLDIVSRANHAFASVASDRCAVRRSTKTRRRRMSNSYGDRWL